MEFCRDVAYKRRVALLEKEAAKVNLICISPSRMRSSAICLLFVFATLC